MEGARSAEGEDSCGRGVALCPGCSAQSQVLAESGPVERDLPGSPGPFAGKALR